MAGTVKITTGEVTLIDSTATGPLGMGLSALLIGRSSASKAGIFVLPGLIDADYKGIIKIMVKAFAPPVTITPGSRIAQLIPFKSKVPVAKQKIRGEGAFGSTGETAGPLVMFTTKIGTERPHRQVKITLNGELMMGKEVDMMLDTGSDVTIVPASVWPNHWPLTQSAAVVSGIGGDSITVQSTQFCCIEDKQERKQAWVKPCVMYTPLGILGRDVMSQWGVTLQTPGF